MKKTITGLACLVLVATAGAQELETVNKPFRAPAGFPVTPFKAVTAAAAPNSSASVSASAGATAVTPTPGAKWEVRVNDVTLAQTVARWGAQAGYRVKWDATRNFLIGAPDTFNGTFEQALAQLLGTPGIRSSDYPLEVCVYANTPPLVRITRQGEQERDCTAVADQ